MLLYKSAYKSAVGSYLRISGVVIAIRIASDDSIRSIVFLQLEIFRT